MERNIKTVMQRRISHYESEVKRITKLQKEAQKNKEYDYADSIQNDITLFNTILFELLYLQKEL